MVQVESKKWYQVIIDANTYLANKKEIDAIMSPYKHNLHFLGIIELPDYYNEVAVWTAHSKWYNADPYMEILDLLKVKEFAE